MSDELAYPGFAIVPIPVLDALSTNPGAVVLYSWLAHYGNGRDGRSWPGRQTLADRMGCSLDTVDRRIRALVDAGWLTVENRSGPNGDATSNLYILRVFATRKSAKGGRTDAATGGRTDAALTRINYEQEEIAARAAKSGGDFRTVEIEPLTELAKRDPRRWTCGHLRLAGYTDCPDCLAP